MIVVMAVVAVMAAMEAWRSWWIGDAAGVMVGMVEMGEICMVICKQVHRSTVPTVAKHNK